MSEKILVVGPSWVGDMMMAQSLFKVLKKEYLGCQIDVLAPSWTRPLTDRMSEVENSLIMPVGHGKLSLVTRFRLGRNLQNKYSKAYILPNSFKSALVPFWARVPHRVAWRGEWRDLLLTDVRQLNKAQYPLMVQRYVALAYDKNQFPGDIPFPKLQVEPNKVNNTLQSFGLDHSRPVLAMCPGAEFGSSKRWPFQYYATVANEYLAKNWQVWLFGSQNDNDVTTKINNKAGDRCHNLAGKTSIEQAIDLLHCANKVLTNDSGLMHVAAALDRSMVAVYGSTSPDYTPPLAKKVNILKVNNIPCSPCFKRDCPLKQGRNQCMEKLTPNIVLNALEGLENESTNS